MTRKITKTEKGDKITEYECLHIVKVWKKMVKLQSCLIRESELDTRAASYCWSPQICSEWPELVTGDPGPILMVRIPSQDTRQDSQNVMYLPRLR